VRLRGVGFIWRQGLASLARHAPSAVIQVVALAIGLMALMLLTVTRGQLLEAWQNATPLDAPNRFVINIQPDQRAAVSNWLSAAGIHAELAPMVRARLLQIGGRSVSAASYPNDERAQRLIEREFNLSWRPDLPAGNRLTAGQWFAAGDSAQASVEEGLARTLGIGVGDELLFSVAGLEKRARVVNLRKLAWDSMQVNFFVLMAPGLIDDAPASFITSFYLPPEHADGLRGLIARFPNLTMIDVGALIGQFRHVVSQVAGAVQFIFLFTLLAGISVLYAALTGAVDERRYELALLRALGARQVQLRQTLLIELALTGALAGLIAGLGANGLGQLMARQIFEFDLVFSVGSVLIAMLAGVLLSVVVGWLTLGRLLRTPPLLVLRNGN
jgi:putative ABC transport system permease protein